MDLKLKWRFSAVEHSVRLFSRGRPSLMKCWCFEFFGRPEAGLRIDVSSPASLPEMLWSWGSSATESAGVAASLSELASSDLNRKIRFFMSTSF